MYIRSVGELREKEREVAYDMGLDDNDTVRVDLTVPGKNGPMDVIIEKASSNRSELLQEIAASEPGLREAFEAFYKEDDEILARIEAEG